MSIRFALAFLSFAFVVSTVRADTTLVDENFDSYTDTVDLETVWTPDAGNGTSPVTGPIGILVPNTGVGLDPPNDDPPGIQGQGVNLSSGGSINEYNGPNLGLLTNLVPTATESIRLGGDIFDAIQGNKRNTIGLRNDTVPLAFGVFASNIVEMGFWNAESFDPFDPLANPPEDGVPSTGYAYRIVLFGDRGSLPHEPTWQYFQLDLVLDIDDTDPLTPDPTPDGLVSPIDIGQGWHRYETVITPTDITFTLDLFRDGVVNVTRDVNGDIEVGVGAPGVDASITWDIAPADNAIEPNPFDPFTSLRFGGASGVSGNNESVVDNILLELVDVVAPGDDADFDDNLLVNGADFLTWQKNFPLNDGTALNVDGDATGDGNILADDLAVWELQYGGPPPLAGLAAVPEPTTAALALLALAGLLTANRRR